MTEKINHYRQLLLDEREKLAGELRGLGAFDKKEKDWQATPEILDQSDRSDLNDMADRYEDFNERSSMLNTLEGRMDEVEAALGRISEEKYGMCEKCGQVIEDDRLEANPAARTCKEHIEK